MSFAGRYVGLPFADRGTDPATGLNCWGLVRLVLEREAGVQGLPHYAETSAADACSADGHFHGAVTSPQWIDVTALPRRLFDCALINGNPLHVGVMIDACRLLHIWRKTDSVIMPIVHPRLRFRILGFYRHRSLP